MDSLQCLGFFLPNCSLLSEFLTIFGIINKRNLIKITHFRSRGVASGLAAALNYFMGFITKKTYYNLETNLSMPGVSLLYCIICGVGLVVMYQILPETEDRSLEDIELHFSDNSKKLTDRKIAKLNISNAKINGTKDRLGPTEKKQIEAGFDNKAFASECSKM